MLPELAAAFGSLILKVIWPLYGILEAGNHWFHMYYCHHTDWLKMETSMYDLCLLHCTELDTGFGIIGMQIDDTLLLVDSGFALCEQ